MYVSAAISQPSRPSRMGARDICNAKSRKAAEEAEKNAPGASTCPRTAPGPSCGGGVSARKRLPAAQPSISQGRCAARRGMLRARLVQGG